MKYTQLNNIIAWIIFLIALITYTITLEPTASYWDCSEFIACAYKLQVSHAPGAPLHMLFGRIFSLLAGSDTSKVAWFVNFFSALLSALTILFLFWTITHFARKMVSNHLLPEKTKWLLIFSSGMVGALSCTFMDTFWFSAVEGEVYAFSSFLTALVFWSILKWENELSSPQAGRWLIFLAYIMGLSIGVHLLNLLAIPAIVFLIYFQKKNLNFKSFLLVLAGSVLIILIILYGIMPGVVWLGAQMDLLFVNGFKLPVNSGFYFYLFLLTGLSVFVLYRTKLKKMALANSICLALVYMLIGYFSYLLVLVRSEAATSINMTQPNNAFSLIHFLAREHYGKRPLFYGHYYNAPVASEQKRSSWVPHQDKYIRKTLNSEYSYDKRFTTLFPRMSDNAPQNIEAYKKWADIKGEKIIVSQNGERATLIKPTFGENLRFFFRYQMGHMYFRYFMWNFTGRQNDIQGFGDIKHGNWISGINFLDTIMFGNQNFLPDDLLENKARNKYYFLPLLLGLIGLLLVWKKDKVSGIAISLFFVFTGIAIVVYLNEVPITPRERDYAYVGSFYAFTIWIGLGLIGLFDLFQRILKNNLALLVSISLSLLIPGLLLKENFDDHNRSNRTIARDFAENVLNSCEPNAILFSFGDNDTYPLWYAQEVEDIRPDIKPVLFPYTNLDWYISQIKKEDNGNLPISFTEDHFLLGQRAYFPIVQRIKEPIDLNASLEFIQSNKHNSMLAFNNGGRMNYLPSNTITIPVKREALIANGMHPEDLRESDSSIDLQLKKSYLLRNEMILLDLIANNQWKRPIYFTSPIEMQKLGFGEYIVQEGLVYRLLPFKTTLDSGVYSGGLNLEKTYDLFMNEFKWGNIADKSIYLDYTSKRQMNVLGVQRTLAKLAEQLLKQGNKEKAKNCLDLCSELFPIDIFRDDYISLHLISLYQQAQATMEASRLANKYEELLEMDLEYYESLSTENQIKLKQEIQRTKAYKNELERIAQFLLKKEMNANG